MTLIQTLIDAVDQSEGLSLNELLAKHPMYTRAQVKNALAIATRTKRLSLLKKPKGLGREKGSTQGLYGPAPEIPKPPIELTKLAASSVWQYAEQAV